MKWVVLLAVLIAGLMVSAEAQQMVFCQTRPPGTSDNSCASTAFVQNAISGAISLVVGSTPITGGTNGYILYDNAGVLGVQPLPSLNAPYFFYSMSTLAGGP